MHTLPSSSTALSSSSTLNWTHTKNADSPSTSSLCCCEFSGCTIATKQKKNVFSIFATSAGSVCARGSMHFSGQPWPVYQALDWAAPHNPNIHNRITSVRTLECAFVFGGFVLVWWPLNIFRIYMKYIFFFSRYYTQAGFGKIACNLKAGKNTEPQTARRACRDVIDFWRRRWQLVRCIMVGLGK